MKSRKPCSTSGRLEPVYFTDRDLGKQFPEILRAGGLDVRRHADFFRPACPDEVWLEDVGLRQWVALTHDRRIRYKPNERAAVIRHKVMLLVVVGEYTPGQDTSDGCGELGDETAGFAGGIL